MRAISSSRGVALILTLLAISLFSALGLGLSMTSSVERLTVTNHDETIAMLNAVDAALEVAARDLAPIADWNRVLDGSTRSMLVDGPPSGVRMLAPSRTIDLTRLTNELTCDRATACTDAQVRASTAERPWGANNPHWRLFVHAWLAEPASPRPRRQPYVIVWIGDDAAEADDDPVRDGGGAAAEGRYLVRAHVEVFAASGARRAAEAELARLCRVDVDVETCTPGIRVKSWRVVAGALP